MLNRIIRLVLLGLLLTAAATAIGADQDLPAAAPRIWAPTGDLVGTQNHATGTVNALDTYGDGAKLAEDTQLVEETSGSALFNWSTTTASGYLFGLRGAGTSADGEGLTGHLAATGSRPGRFGYTIELRRANQFFDTDSELRDALFGNPPPPPFLTATPVLEWTRADVKLGWRLTEAVALRLGLRQIARDGNRGSLLRAATGDAVPGLKGYDAVKSRELNAGVSWAASSLAIDLDGTLRTQDGDRSLGTAHTWQDDRTDYRGTLGVQWQAAARTRLHGSGSVAKLENAGSETFQGEAVAQAGETSTSAGQLGLVHRLGQDLTLRAAARFSSANTDADATLGADPQQTVARDRTRQDYRVGLTHTGLKATRLDLRYRLRTSKREEVTVDGGSFATDEDRTESELVFRGRRRFSRAVLLKLKAGWSSLDREQTRNWADPALRYWMDDYTRDQVHWDLALQTRPGRDLKLDLGHRYHDATFTNEITDGVETCRRRSEAYANLNWTAATWLTVYGTVSVGTEKMETGDAVTPDAGMGALNVDATTWRWVPGATAQLTSRLRCEAMYEGLRYEDTGDTDGALGNLQSDHDRVLLRAAYELKESLTMTATYRRAEFFENRWDNTIADLYGLSLTGRF